MTPERTYLLFKNDIAATIADARNKGKDDAEVDFRVREVWGMSLVEYNTLASN